jgi:hypothetical protein
VTTLLLIPLCAAGILVAAPGTACACDCGTPTAQKAFEHADAVFVGRVVGRKVDRSFPWIIPTGVDTVVWTFEVAKVYKGKVRQRQEVVSHVQTTACGLDFQDSGPFVVYATANDPDLTVEQGQLVAHRCNGTGPVTPEIRRALAAVRATDPASTPEGEQRWLVVGLSTAAGIGVLATGAWWLWRRGQRPTG